jgi:hypothetical protein
MWCIARRLSRHLAVNKGKQRRSADSGAIRSARVPNLKTPSVLRRISGHWMAWQLLAAQTWDQNLPAELAQRCALKDAMHAGACDAEIAGTAIDLIGLVTLSSSSSIGAGLVVPQDRP